ncbi:unnamed protein product [Bathycoccus prasinos]
MKKIHRVGGEKMMGFLSSILLPLLLLLSCCRANALEQQQQQKTVISQQKLENGVLFKVVVSASVPVDSSDVLFNRGVLATTKAQKIRVWCLDMQPRAGKKKNKKNEAEETEDNKSMELSDVFLWHDETTDSQDWYEKKESIGNQLAKKNVRSVACDMPGYGRSEGEKKFAASSDLARSSFQEQLFEKLEMKRPVVFAPGVSMSYVVPLATVKPSALGGVATCEMESGWAVEKAERRRNTERALRYLKTTLERLPEKASEIPVKTFLKREKQDAWVEKVQREFAGMFPLTDVVYLEGRVHCTDAKNENDVSIGLIRLSALAMLSNGKASGLVRKAILAKKKAMPRIEEEEEVEVEPVKTTIEWEDEGTSGGGEERSGEGEFEGEATSSEDSFGGGDGEYEEDLADERGQEQRQEQQQRKKRFWTGRRLLMGDDIEP